jgi:hypothetical protein
VVSDDLPGMEEATRAVFPGAGRKLCLHARSRKRQDQGEALRLG